MKNLFKSTENILNYVLIFIASMGISYGLISELVFNKKETGIIFIMAVCLCAGYSSKTNQSKA
jgi:hypothetical protein